MRYATMLTIAGSDSIGGAGIQADIKTATALGVYALSAVTAITVQNTLGVSGFMPCPPTVLRDQLDAIFTDVEVDAVKIGMIPDRACADVIADAMERYDVRQLVVDPVLAATSGDKLAAEGMLDVMLRRLFPLATVVTPNLPEASVILGRTVSRLDDMADAARELLASRHPQAVLLKGGHLLPDSVTNPQPDSEPILLTDVLATPEHVRAIRHAAVATRNTHGTGCSLSSALACCLAKGEGLDQAVDHAIAWLAQAIASGANYNLGRGHGPVNHLFNILPQ
jgi:hydroxymethylpyrimidine/phosphomethylpyrimidine kinase